MTTTHTTIKTPWVKQENQYHLPFVAYMKGTVSAFKLEGYTIMQFHSGMCRVELGAKCLFSGNLEAAKKFLIAEIEKDKPMQIGEEWLTN